jgi:hypothetical protein
MKKGYAFRTFRDAGTEETFEGGKDHDFEPGAFANYKAAGLVRAARPHRRAGKPAA